MLRIFVGLAILLLGLGCTQQPPTATPGPWGDVQTLEARIADLERAVAQAAEYRRIDGALYAYHRQTARLIHGTITLEEAHDLIGAAVAYDEELADLWAQVVNATTAEQMSIKGAAFRMVLFENAFSPPESTATAQR